MRRDRVGGFLFLMPTFGTGSFERSDKNPARGAPAQSPLPGNREANPAACAQGPNAPKKPSGSRPIPDRAPQTKEAPGPSAPS